MPAKILIVEDNSDSRNFLAALLKLKGYAVHTAADGVEGIDSVKTNCPDLIISDLTMPNLDGIGMLKILRTMPACSQIPILVMSAYGSGKLEEAVEVGANHILRKPLNVDLLLNTINKFLGQPLSPSSSD